MVDSFLKNLYEKYWEERPVEHHRNIIGEYHVSTVGCDHSDLDSKEHSGPCLRQTFYVYVNPKEQTLQTKGNFGQGHLMHNEVERIYVMNNHGSMAEFPLGRMVHFKGVKFNILGSIDILDSGFTDKSLTNWIDIIDLKSSSDWTFPKDNDDKNPTHFDQTKIYTGILILFVLNMNYNKIRTLKIVYMAKHNQYTGEQEDDFIFTECLEKYNSFINRCYTLHTCLLKNELPDAEPMKWCSLCDYRDRCTADVILDKDVPTVTLKEVMELYNKMTGKNAIWRGKETKGFKIFKFRYKIEGD